MMSKEVAAALLTQAYFQSSPTAAKRVNAEVEADKVKGIAADGAIAPIVLTYGKVREFMDKLADSTPK